MARLKRPSKLSLLPAKPKIRRQLPGQTLLRSPKRPEVMKHSDTNIYQFLRVQAVSAIQAQRFGASQHSIRKRFDTACDVEFHLARELDEDDKTYNARCAARRKTFWRPSFKWAVDMLRYQPQGKGIWQPLNLHAINLVRPATGPRPRPRPSFHPKRHIHQKSVASSPSAVSLLPSTASSSQAMASRLQPTASSTKLQASSSQPPESTATAFSLSSSSTFSSWPSKYTLLKIQRRELASLEPDEIKEMEAVAILLRSYAQERARLKSPEL